jgi:hypothetical protein
VFDHHNGRLELKPLKVPCHDCAVVNGFYACFAEELSKLKADRIDYVSKRWFCHNNPSRACAGNIEYQRKAQS